MLKIVKGEVMMIRLERAFSETKKRNFQFGLSEKKQAYTIVDNSPSGSTRKILLGFGQNEYSQQASDTYSSH
jgi:hypothetical protein